MAVTVTPNLTEISSADTASTGGTWLGNSGGADTEVKIQGNGSYTWQAAKNARTSCTFTPTANLDLSGADVHIYWWAKNDVAPFMEPFTEVADDPGYTIRLTDGSGNYKEWRIAGSDTWGGEWRCFVLDVNSTTDVYASSGTLDLSDIDVITWSVDISNSGNIRIIDNQWNDMVRYGTGLTLTGTSFDFSDAAADDELSANKYGILQNIDGVIYSQGRINVGNGATTTTLNSTDEVLIFRDRVSDSGSGQVSSTLYQLNFVGSGCTTVVTGLICKGAGSTDLTRPVIDASDTNADITISGSSFIHTNLVSFSSSSDIQGCVFNDCYQIDPSTSTFKYHTISNYGGPTGGAIYWPSDDSNISDLTFINNVIGIEYGTGSDATGPAFNNCEFDDQTGYFDVNNTSGATATIALAGTSDANSYTGAFTDFQSSATLSMTVQDENGDPVGSAFAYIDDDDETPYIMNTTTNVTTGIAQTSWTGGYVASARWRVRKYGYKPFKVITSIPASGTKDIPVTLIADPQQT